jgi:hypothetical protein
MRGYIHELLHITLTFLSIIVDSDTGIITIITIIITIK